MSNSDTINSEVPRESPTEVSSEVSNEVTCERYMGRVKWFNHTRGYGFVTGINGQCEGNDIFVHHTSFTTKENVYRSLSQGEYIEFNLEKDSDGKDCAKDVTGIKRHPLLCEIPRPPRGRGRDNTST